MIKFTVPVRQLEETLYFQQKTKKKEHKPPKAAIPEAKCENRIEGADGETHLGRTSGRTCPHLRGKKKNTTGGNMSEFPETLWTETRGSNKQGDGCYLW
jgi:hypothetical protein